MRGDGGEARKRDGTNVLQLSTRSKAYKINDIQNTGERMHSLKGKFGTTKYSQNTHKNNFTIRELPEEERPRERLIKYGSQALSNAELLAIILRTGSQKQNVVDLAKRLLIDYDLKSLSQLSTGDLKKTFGIGLAKACQVIAAFELGRRVASNSNNGEKPLMNNPHAVAEFFMPQMRILKQETFQCVYLNTKNRLIKTQVISVGSLNANIVDPKDVFRGAISEGAASVIVLHNHPSGDPTPSTHDIEVTKKLATAGEIIDVKVVDHIIIGDGKWVSLKEERLF